ncbi:MAG: Holliday junction branch migration protein RuvA [Ignavibacteriae bacterium]|nr:Holliday junction branch migration protein RuvA [Ignavibacteriota bacterium]
MISYLKGKLSAVQNNEIILDVNGVGYGVFITKKVKEHLPEMNGEMSLITFLDVKENSLTLYGFFDVREKEIFKLLVSVNGISSKTAHNILSYAGFEDIVGLITNRNALSGIKIPGIGDRKIEMISVALKDKVFKLSEGFEVDRSSFESTDAFAKEQSRLDALNALMNLGYNRTEGERIIREVLKTNPETSLSTEELIKKALGFGS